MAPTAGAQAGWTRSKHDAVARRALGGLAILASVTLLCASPHAQTTAETAEPQPPVIDRVTIVRQNVFSKDEKQAGILGDTPLVGRHPFGARLRKFVGPGELDIAGWANRLHFKTQPEVIKPELLFAPGQPLDPPQLDETERNLRETGIFRDASVTSQTTSPGHAGVTVLTQDAWTTIPMVGFAVLGGGSLTGQAGISESNLFGFGNAAQLFHSIERYRDVDFAGYEDPRIWGTHWHLLGEASEDSDGRVRSALLEYPFWSLEIPDSVGAGFSHVSDRERLLSQGGNLFRHWQTAATFEAAHALVAQQDLVRRIGLRYQLWDDSFAGPPGSSLNPAFGLEPRRTSAMELTFTEWHPDFVKAYYLDELGHPEDRDVGWAWETRLGYSPAALRASRSEFVMGSSASFGGRIRDETYAWLWMQTSGREGSGSVHDGFITIEGIAYQRLADFLNHKQTLVIDARTDLSSGLFRDHEFVIGSDDGGVRGYPVNYRAGTRRMLFHIEDRLAIVEDLLHLISLGVVGFADAGQVWGRGRTLSSSEMLASVGIGLRLSSTRSRFQIPVRFDFAIPLIHHGGVNPADFSVGASQAFGTFGQPFLSDANSIADPENLAPDSEASPYPNASPFAYAGSSFTDY